MKRKVFFFATFDYHKSADPLPVASEQVNKVFLKENKEKLFLASFSAVHNPFRRLCYNRGVAKINKRSYFLKRNKIVFLISINVMFPASRIPEPNDFFKKAT
jgi:hypothetical protein